MSTLVKILSLTQSPNDHETLAAIRKANSVLQQNGWSWEDLVYGRVKPLRRALDADKIEAALSLVARHPFESGAALFLLAVRDRWEKSRSLTAEQRHGLMRAARTVAGKRWYH